MDLFGLHFRLCLLALTLQLEETALKLILQNPEASWDALPDKQKEKAKKTYRRWKGGSNGADRSPYRRLLSCTSFNDKDIIIAKRKLFGRDDMNITKVFQEAGTIRNYCAHTKPEDIPEAMSDPEALNKAVQDIQQLILRLDNACY